MKHATRNWQTTIAGILALVAAGFSVYQDPTKLADPTVMGAIAGGVGLIAAKDGAAAPEAPADKPKE